MSRSERRLDLFAGLPHQPRQHFTLYFYGALLRALNDAALHYGGMDAAVSAVPCLAGYLKVFGELGFEGTSFQDAHGRWLRGLEAWERHASERLPLAALRAAAGLVHDDLVLLAQVGLGEEDPRLGLLYDALQGGSGERHPTAALLSSSRSQELDWDPRTALHRLRALGLVEPVPGGSGGLRPTPDTWEAVRGGVLAAGWARALPCEELPQLEQLVLPPALRQECARLVDVLAAGAASAVVVRGARHNGRTTLCGALARELGKGLLQLSELEGPRDPRWRSAASLACLLDAALVTSAAPGPSETLELPELPEGLAPLFLTLGNLGAVTGALAARAITLRLPIPARTAREELWQRALGAEVAGAAALRLTSGNIVRAACVARAGAAVHGGGRGDVAPVDAVAVRTAVRSLERAGLEALARRVETVSGWARLALPRETMAELTALAARCRQRERLGAYVGEALEGIGPGVRALLKGPSGTGKTLAARVLAGELGMDLYRVDLAAVVNKYIGETEKSLEKVFAAAEELDVVLLLDEGDALLTSRTSVQNANDRYANLETNYLLQRLESYEGILLVTTNAGDRIDGAFQRRMDVVIDFPLPDVPERWLIWQSHLPAGHAVEPEVLRSAAQRCALTGGQIRNAALHASLLAVESGTAVSSAHLESAIAREYRKLGAISPLRPRLAR